jgi:preprotein translocase subunit SecF
MFVIKYRWIFFTLSALLIAGSLFLLGRYGLKWGMDFTGGTILEVEYAAARPDLEAVRQALTPFHLGEFSLQPAGNQSLILRLKEVTVAEKEALAPALNLGGKSPYVETRFNAIGPALGSQLANRAFLALALVVLLIILFIAFAFRKVARPVSSWKYGVITLVALLHDLIIPTGVFAWLGYAHGVEVDALFLTGLLTILGLSVHDTIVVFDRIRENLGRRSGQPFAEVVGRSLTETFTRSINTSLTIIFVLLILYFFGAQSTHYFSLLMAIGVLVGTYSSIFIASPLLVVWEKLSRPR